MTKYQGFQAWVWQIVQPDWMDEVSQWESKLFDIVIALCIIISTVGVLLCSVTEFAVAYAQLLYWVEIVTVAIFTFEYLIRFWSSVADPRWDENFTSRVSYVISPMAIIDLLAIAPFYVGLFTSAEWAQWLLASRMLRLLKLGWYSPSFRFLGDAIWKKRSLFAASGYLAVVLVLCASVPLWILEGEAQPDKFGSIPNSMWWAVVTLTTVGYGDAFPITTMGKIVAGVLALCGIGIVCLPTAILAGEFAQIFSKDNSRSCPGCKSKSPSEANFCSHCGKQFESSIS